MDGESENARRARIEALWRSMHNGPIVPLDLDGLRDGLRKIDHPLANAEGLLKDIMHALDANHDGQIEFDEFCRFVESAENELWQLFRRIDHNGNGKLDKAELGRAFRQAGISIDEAKLVGFFDRIDANHDGEISFEEWRDFLIFLPIHSPNLKQMLSYFSAALIVNAEGDVSVGSEGHQGLGTAIFSVLFGAGGHHKPRRPPRPTHLRRNELGNQRDHFNTRVSDRNTFPWDPGEHRQRSHSAMAKEDPPSSEHPNGKAWPAAKGLDRKPEVVDSKNAEIELRRPSIAQMLTHFVPPPGYFVAGGIAGAVSRTCTAPLDRLKVYLIAQTSVKEHAVHALKSGSPTQFAKHALRPLMDATRELWRMGGLRSLWAGNGLNVLKVMPESGIKFGAYEGAKRVAARLEGHDDPKSLGGLAQFFAAGLGGSISQLASYPVDTLKFRMQCETVEGGLQGNKLIIETAQKMWRTNGMRAYYRGLGPGLVGMFPFVGIDLTLYEWLRYTLIARTARARGCSPEDATPSSAATGGIGAISSSIGATAVYPLNLIRTRLQSQGTAIHSPTYHGWRDCFTRTVKAEGWRGLYRGLTPNLLKVVPSMSISYMTYEASKKLLGLQ